MRKHDIDCKVAAFTGMSVRDVQYVTKTFFDIAGAALVESSILHIPRFGRFSVVVHHEQSRAFNDAFNGHEGKKTKVYYTPIRVHFKKSTVLSKALQEKHNGKAGRSRRNRSRDPGKEGS